MVLAEEEEEVFEAVRELLLTVLIEGTEECLLVEEGRTGSSSSTSWGVRVPAAEEVGISPEPRTSPSICEDSLSSARKYPTLSWKRKKKG